MNAGIDEETIATEGGGAGEVGVNRIPDHEDAPVRPATARGRGECGSALVDGPVWLAGIDHFAAEFLVESRDRAGAIDDIRTARDDEIGIGADHRQRTRQEPAEQRAVILRRLDGVVEEARAHHIIGRIGGAERNLELAEQGQVAFRTEMEGGLARPRQQKDAGDVAGRRDGIVGRACDAELVELLGHDVAGPRRIGDQDDAAAPGTEAHQGLARVGERHVTVVNHAPDVAQNDIVVGGEGAELIEQRGQTGHRQPGTGVEGGML